VPPWIAVARMVGAVIRQGAHLGARRSSKPSRTTQPISVNDRRIAPRFMPDQGEAPYHEKHYNIHAFCDAERHTQLRGLEPRNGVLDHFPETEHDGRTDERRLE
jgi:hypothetical protein